MQGFSQGEAKKPALEKERSRSLYQRKDSKTGDLFSEIFPYGGKLNESNQWIKLSKLIPWEKMAAVYGKYFSEVGRPCKDSRLITGLLIIKHRRGYSDRDLIEQFLR